jgi:hypothetical protein
MTAIPDRRHPHVSRVPLTKLVDICPTEDGTGAFQGESANVSGRGMSLRTSHLPELGQELLCRFEHKGQEVLVEGRVAWRAETEEGGEFGLQFTALDADSTDVIRDLGQTRAAPAPAPVSVKESELEPEVGKELAAGHRVRLHVEGLGAPMKAAVHTATERRIRVGSQLEFLKVGRAVELEELGLGTRRSARVDSVNVIINPATSIPELVVQLKYAGLPDTPAPAVTQDKDLQGGEAHLSASAAEGDEDDLDGDPLLPLPPAAAELGRRMAGWARRASSLAGQASATLGQAALQAKESASSVLERSTRSAPPSAPKMTSSSAARRRLQGSRRPGVGAPAHLRSGIHDLGLTGREKAPRTSSAPEGSVRRFSPRLWAGLALVPIVLVGSALATRALSSDKTGAGPSATPPSEGAAKTELARAPASAPPPVAAPTKPEVPTNPDGIALEVPLFGPRTVATSEPVAAGAEVDEATAEKLAAAAAVPDQVWPDDAETTITKATAAKENTPWGRGRLHLPTIHRIRLDAPGAEIAGAVEQEGFVVVIPGRKAMESGRAIQGRDKRILKVLASNTAEGARVRFEFRGSVPAYRVRLRNDFIEFLISAPEDSLAKL